MKTLGKTIVLLMIILIILLGGALILRSVAGWKFDFLFQPVAKALGMQQRTSQTITSTDPIVFDRDGDKLRKQRESLDLYREELDKREAEIAQKEKLNEQIASELANREKSQEERERTFELMQKQMNDKNLIVEQLAAYLNGMAPENSVAILESMDDQVVIDILRKVEEIAKRDGTSSMGGYWLSLMKPERAAVIKTKMLNKPAELR